MNTPKFVLYKKKYVDENKRVMYVHAPADFAFC